jgi:hypothetical protein
VSASPRLAPLDDGSQPSLQEEQTPLNLHPSIPLYLIGALIWKPHPASVAMTQVTLNRGNSELLPVAQLTPLVAIQAKAQSASSTCLMFKDCSQCSRRSSQHAP